MVPVVGVVVVIDVLAITLLTFTITNCSQKNLQVNVNASESFKMPLRIAARHSAPGYRGAGRHSLHFNGLPSFRTMPKAAE